MCIPTTFSAFVLKVLETIFPTVEIKVVEIVFSLFVLMFVHTESLNKVLCIVIYMCFRDNFPELCSLERLHMAAVSSNKQTLACGCSFFVSTTSTQIWKQKKSCC